jgi:hypothetical protein
MESEGENQRPPWQIVPYEEESISHYLGRLRRHEAISASAPSGLGQALGLGVILNRWEKLRFNPFPGTEELEIFSKFSGLELEQLLRMFPPPGERSMCVSIRLCAACYVEAPYHRMKWQSQSTVGCDRHQLLLLSKCPGCEKPFPLPALWIKGECQRCRMPFKTMVRKQKKSQ